MCILSSDGAQKVNIPYDYATESCILSYVRNGSIQVGGPRFKEKAGSGQHKVDRARFLRGLGTMRVLVALPSLNATAAGSGRVGCCMMR